MEYALVFILTVLTIIFWSGKGSWLIAGYNTMDDKEKQNRGRCEMAYSIYDYSPVSFCQCSFLLPDSFKYF